MFDSSLDSSFQTPTGQLLLNFCRKLSGSCSGFEDKAAFKKNGECTNIALTGQVDSNKNQVVAILDKGQLTIQLPDGQANSAEDTPYQLTIALECSKKNLKDISLKISNINEFDESKSVNNLMGTSLSACPIYIQLIDPTFYIFNYRYYFAVPVLIISFIFLFFGFKIVNIAIFLIVFSLTYTILFAICIGITAVFVATGGIANIGLLALFCLIIFVISALAGYMAIKSVKYIFFILGFLVGLSIGQMLVMLLLFWSPFMITNYVLAFIGGLILGVYAGIKAYHFKKYAILGFVSLVGSTTFTQSLYYFIGKFEYPLFNKYLENYGEPLRLGGHQYVLIIVIITSLLVFGLNLYYYQMKYYSKQADEYINKVEEQGLQESLTSTSSH